MALSFTTATKNACLDAFTTRFNAGTTNPTGALRIYTAGGPESGTLLGTALFANPAFPLAAAGATTTSNITRDDGADATGVAAVVIYCDRDRTEVARGTVTDTTGNGDLKMISTSVTQGEPFEVSSVSFSF